MSKPEKETYLILGHCKKLFAFGNVLNIFNLSVLLAKEDVIAQLLEPGILSC